MLWADGEEPGRERELESYRLTGDWSDQQLQGQTLTTPNQSHGTDNEMIVKQLWEELPDPDVGELSRSFESRRGKKVGRNGDVRVKLERSRQSARECRARKKLRYQYLDDLILEREKANERLREELMQYQKWCHELDKGRIPDGLQDMLREFKSEQQQANM